MPRKREALIERIWWGEGAGSRALRLALRPASAVFGAVVRVRNGLYDSGALASRPLGLPAISVGNLSVGGTGKTPVAAWVAGRAKALGATPAIVLRGYGDDEPLVHAELNPGIPVVVGADRLAAAARARELGADLVVLDDAFQHRRARRDLDLVLLSAERWTGRTPLLPAGPWREPLGCLVRASMVLVTRKTASPDRASGLADELALRAGGIPTGVVALLPGELRRLDDGAARPTSELAGARVLAIAAVGHPEAFIGQLTALGARVEAARFPDHHAFSDADVERLVRRGKDVDHIVCTLKDAVKLRPRWPRQGPSFWYVSQRVVIERGDEALAGLIGSVVRARAAQSRTAASSRQIDRSHEH